MSVTDTLTEVVQELLSALEPLVQASEGPEEFSVFMADLGWDVSGPIAPIRDLFGVAHTVHALIQDDQAAAPTSAELLNGLQQVVSGVRGLASIGSGSLPGTIDGTEFAAKFPRQLIDFVVVQHLLGRRSRIGSFLRLCGVIRIREVPAAGQRLAYRSREIAWEDLAGLLKNPAAVFTNAYKWGQDDFDGVAFLNACYHFASACGLNVSVQTPNDSERAYLQRDATPAALVDPINAIVRWPLLESRPEIEFGLDLGILPLSSNRKPGFAIVPYLEGGVFQTFALSDNLRIRLSVSFDMAGGVSLHIRPAVPPSLDIGFLDGALAAAAKFTTALEYSPGEGQTLTILGDPKGTRLETEGMSLLGGIRIQTETTPDAFTELDIKRAALVISLGGGSGDSFLTSVLPKEISAGFGLTVGLSSLRGVYFRGSAALEIQLPVHIALGPIEIESATIGIRPTAQSIPIDLTATIKADLSVLKAVVENVGVRVELTMPPGGGRLGPFDFGMSFRPPKGVGLSVDVGPVKGGGYLYFDFDNEEYAGALELMFSDIVNLKVIGLITTKMPDGSHGFSMLLIITAEFGAGLQLGYGFKLIGVGGLLGLNRKMLIQPLTEGVRTGAVNNILFPKDVVANAPRIISDLRTIFPPEPNKFLIGPMAKIGWGTPTLITLSLGIIIEIPGNIVILGVLGLILPDLKSPVVVIQVAFVGAIEFDKKRVYFFAAMFDSRVLFITMAGEMGVLVAFGDNPDFVLSVGGFHPSFNPPPLPFPTPKRISLSILNESYGRILAETYFAVTTNTVQFGASASLFFGYAGFSVEGSIIFDALMRFSPFYFIITLKTTVSLKVFGAGLFSLDIDLALEGTSPWRARGQGTIRILLWDVHKEFDETWGERVNTVLLPLDVMGLLVAELKKIENWNATLAPGNTLLVSLRKLPEQPGVLVLHPLGSLRISQRSVPLDVTIDKVGNQKPSDARRFKLRETTGNFSRKGDVSEQFAPAQFKDMSDPEKLSRPSFEPLNGGMELSAQGAELTASRLVKRIVRYEQIIIDTNYKRLVSHLVVFVTTLFEHFLNGNAVTLSTLSDNYKTLVKPNPDTIQMKPDQYAVAFTHDNRAVEQQAAGFSSAVEAREFLDQQVAADPNLAARMHVIPAHELNAA